VEVAPAVEAVVLVAAVAAEAAPVAEVVALRKPILQSTKIPSKKK
jgi:hypothetical protein